MMERSLMMVAPLGDPLEEGNQQPRTGRTGICNVLVELTFFMYLFEVHVPVQ
jgi:hypothetical protein